MATGDLQIAVGVGDQQTLGGGLKVIKGGLLLGTYNTTGSLCNLANYFATSTYPLVMVSTSNGITFEHNHGTAAAGKVKAYYTVMQVATLSNASFNTAMGEVPDATSLATINIPFIAIGQPF